MIPVSHLAGRKVVLFGLGGSGLATAKALVAGGAEVVAFDDNPASVEKASAESIDTADLRTIDWGSQSTLVLAPGVPFTHPKPHWTVELAKETGVPIIGDVELFFRERRNICPEAKIIAITGTNGKSTTTALISHVLQHASRDVQMGGNIGKAVLTLEPFTLDRIYVVEVSSYQIDLAPTLDPDVGILLNLSPDHLERHGTIENYAALKERLVASSKTAIVGVDDEQSAAIAARLQKNGSQSVHTISTNAEAGEGEYTYRDNALWLREQGVPAKIADMAEFPALLGAHNAENALAALNACRDFLSIPEILEGFRTFPGLAHRMERVGSVGKVLFINDSKATNADAAATGLSSFDRVFWIAGGLPKEGGIAGLAPLFSRVAKAYLVGEAAPDFAATIGDTIPYEISGTLKDAVNHALTDASLEREGAIVLLSPAAASFDQFQNFEKRGEAFQDAVAALDGFQPMKG